MQSVPRGEIESRGAIHPPPASHPVSYHDLSRPHEIALLTALEVPRGIDTLPRRVRRPPALEDATRGEPAAANRAAAESGPGPSAALKKHLGHGGGGAGLELAYAVAEVLVVRADAVSGPGGLKAVRAREGARVVRQADVGGVLRVGAHCGAGRGADHGGDRGDGSSFSGDGRGLKIACET